ncbi:hypothetical protein K431DRAFT_266560 [Polychaeton citri CBS 116435]|uniref:Zn(2)-C6 fungal-type domain-containing protein n=1 Tax=Polychaeton citri CBS 116435 TaxID=1314669 RepID=A0A9P4Q9Z9_9PEZI|nr:hypothetical protein K431DRAFT_266560 [Polychaeton citri CBS 116435]
MPAEKTTGAVRKRKSHKKSRKGCVNCKVRRVKCDEEHPSCQQCTQFGVQCRYGCAPSDMDLSSTMAGVFQLETPKRAPVPGQSIGDFLEGITLLAQKTQPQAPLTPPDDKDHACHDLDKFDATVFEYFKAYTVPTMGTTLSMPMYSREIPRLAMRHQFLMHMVLTLTIRHYRWTCEDSSPRMKEAEAFHWYHGTSQFNDLLSNPIKEEERDAIWATATFLGAMSWSDIEGTTPEEAWPMRPDSPDDLEWMKMGTGKTAIWRLADPLRIGSCFRETLVREAGENFTAKQTTVPAVPSEHQRDIFALCDMAEDGTADRLNPYADMAKTMARLIAIEITAYNAMEFLVVLSHMSPDFKAHLAAKDPRALLLVSLWYSKAIAIDRWWLTRRCRVEGQSIVMYLQKWHWQDVKIRKLLQITKPAFGMEREKSGILSIQYGQLPWMAGECW